MTEKERPSSSQPDPIRSSYYKPEDEINILDLLEVLVRKKVLVFATASIFTVLSIFYAFSITPIYRATIGFQPYAKSLTSLFPDFISEILPNISRSSDGDLVREESYLLTKFLTEFQSYPIQEKVFIDGEFLQRFIASNPNIDNRKGIVQEINRSMHVKTNGLSNQIVTVEMEGTKPEVISDFLNSLAERAKSEVISRAKESMQKEIKGLMNEYSAELKIYRSKEKAEKADKVKLFSDNLEIAKNLGILDNNFGGSSANAPFVIGKRPIWYLYGQRALEQELNVLKRRGDSVQYIEETAELAYKIAYLSKIDLSKINFEPVIISLHSMPPVHSINLNKPKIIVIGIALGLIIGIVMAFLSYSITQLKERSKLSPPS